MWTKTEVPFSDFQRIQVVMSIYVCMFVCMYLFICLYVPSPCNFFLAQLFSNIFVETKHFFVAASPFGRGRRGIKILLLQSALVERFFVPYAGFKKRKKKEEEKKHLHLFLCGSINKGSPDDTENTVTPYSWQFWV